MAAVGLVDPGKGISLRFPRFMRVRDDKDPQSATDARQVATMYTSQANVQASGLPASVDFEEDDYF